MCFVSYQGCFSEFWTTNGTFQTPNYPNVYPAEANCPYRIHMTKNSNLNISFLHFDLEPKWVPRFMFGPVPSCEYDSVRVSANSSQLVLMTMHVLRSCPSPKIIVSITTKHQVKVMKGNILLTFHMSKLWTKWNVEMEYLLSIVHKQLV